MKIIINADDFGKNNIVNLAVFNLLKDKAITSATIMANGRAIDEAIAMAKEFPEASFGVHLNLTNFSSLTEGIKKTRFCDSKGDFNAKYREFARPKDRFLVFNELLSQVELLREKGLKISHFDSHHHVHTSPMTFFPLGWLLKATGIFKVRNTLNVYQKRQLKNPKTAVKGILKKQWTYGMRIRHNAIMTNKFCSVTDFERAALEEPMSIPQTGSLELMCHPGDNSNHEYVRECEILRAGLGNIYKLPFELISYNEIE